MSVIQLTQETLRATLPPLFLAKETLARVVMIAMRASFAKDCAMKIDYDLPDHYTSDEHEAFKLYVRELLKKSYSKPFSQALVASKLTDMSEWQNSVHQTRYTYGHVNQTLDPVRGDLQVKISVSPDEIGNPDRYIKGAMTAHVVLEFTAGLLEIVK